MLIDFKITDLIIDFHLLHTQGLILLTSHKDRPMESDKIIVNYINYFKIDVVCLWWIKHVLLVIVLIARTE